MTMCRCLAPFEVSDPPVEWCLGKPIRGQRIAETYLHPKLRAVDSDATKPIGTLLIVDACLFDSMFSAMHQRVPQCQANLLNLLWDKYPCCLPLNYSPSRPAVLKQINMPFVAHSRLGKERRGSGRGVLRPGDCPPLTLNGASEAAKGSQVIWNHSPPF